MFNLPLQLAWRYLRFKKKDKNISLMVKICFVGISIGTFALMLTLIITNGFEKTIAEKMQGINSQVVITFPSQKLNIDSIRSFLKQKFPEVEAVSGSSIKQVIIQKNDTKTLVILKGIESEEEKVTNLAQKIINPKNVPLQKLLQDDGIVIGHKMAAVWNLKPGDSIKILIPDSGTKTKIYLTKQKVQITGIFNVGLDEYDSGFAFSSLKFLQDVFDEEGVDQASLKLSFSDTPFYKRMISDQENLLVERLRKNMPELTVSSWKDLYPALVSSLKLEKYVMFLIIALITLVASLNMISLLFIQIQQKRRDVAIFKAMGMRGKDIKTIFLTIGLTITFLASLLGLALAAVAGFFLEKYPFIELPDVYYVTHLPARMEPELFVIVFACTLLLGFLATWIPAKRASKINIAEVLRME